MAHMVFCTRYKAEMEGLDEPPFDSDFGQKIDIEAPSPDEVSDKPLVLNPTPTPS